MNTIIITIIINTGVIYFIQDSVLVTLNSDGSLIGNFFIIIIIIIIVIIITIIIIILGTTSLMATSDTAGLSFGKVKDEDVLYVTDPMSFAMINTTNGKTLSSFSSVLYLTSSSS